MKNPLALPMPKDLGHPSNALPMELFPNEGDDKNTYTWEKHYRDMKAKYPIRYFLNETFKHWWGNRVGRPISDFTYWLKCHLLPSYKYHLLDLRQPKGNQTWAYRHGWIDSDTQILFANFNILCNYVEKELGTFPEFTEEDLNDPCCNNKAWKEHYDEVKFLYYWWKVERGLKQKKHDELLTRCYGEGRTSATAEMEKELRDMEAAMEQEETDNLIRLIKIRKGMWT